MISPQISFASSREADHSSPQVSQTGDGLIIEWAASSPQISINSNGRSAVEIPGFEVTSEPATARLPFGSIMIALPHGSTPSIEIITSTTGTVPLPAPLELAGQPEGVDYSEDGQILGGTYVPATKELASDRQVVMLEEIGILRGVRLARLVFYPALPNGDSLSLTFHMVVEVKFNQSQRIVSAAVPAANHLISAIKSAVVNPEQIQFSPFTNSADPSLPSLQLAINPTAAIEVSKRGMIEITPGDLQEIGFPIDVDPKNLKITRDGQGIALDWQGDEDDNFEANEKLLFFADPRFSRWSPFDTYYLSVGNSNGLRMGSRTADPGGVTTGTAWVEATFEENRIYTPYCFCPTIPAGFDGDRWVWKMHTYARTELEPNPPPTIGEYPFELPGADFSQNPIITIWLIGRTDTPQNPDHSVKFYINDAIPSHNIGELVWDGKQIVQNQFTIDASLLSGDSNSLIIEMPGTSGVNIEQFWLDAFSIRYARSTSSYAGDSLGFSGQNSRRKYTVSLTSITSDQMLAYDVSIPNQPVILNGFDVQSNNAQYSATLADPVGEGIHNYFLTMESKVPGPDRLRMLTAPKLGADFNGADYLIISPAKFIPSLTDLVQVRESAGLKVAIEEVQAIYDNYGDGRPLPEAIKSFLEHAYLNWDLPPTFVLLVGDGTHDPKQYSENSTQTFIPAYLEDVDPWSDETATDNRYVTVDGGDTLPDMIIGRLPVNNIAELDTIIAKIVAYEAQSDLTSWKHQALFVADNPDFAGNFPLFTETLISNFPNPPFSAQRLYFSPGQWTPEEFSQMLKKRWNAGSGMIMFTGHSSIFQWAHEIFLHRENIPDLTNGQKLPVVLEMTCFTSSFQIPDYPTLDEDLLRHPNGGAVATWGSTGFGVATGHHWLAEGFMDSIYNPGGSDIGTAALVGKLNLAKTGANADLIDTFTLLGDPAIHFNNSYNQYLPLSHK